MAGTLETALATPDEDLTVEQFTAYMKELIARFETFTTKGQEEHPDQFATAQTRADWFEELQAYQDTLDEE